METVLLLAIVAAVVVTFVQLRRRLGDEWPPIAAGSREEIERNVPPPARPTPAPPQPPSSPLTEWEEDEPVVVLAPTTAVADTPPISMATVVPAAEPPAPAVAEPVRIEHAAAFRRAGWVLAGGGVLLAILALIVVPAVPEGGRLPSFALIALGGAALLAGLGLARGAPGGRLGRALSRAAAFLRVAPAQVALLILALGFAYLTRQAAGDGILAYRPGISVASWVAAIVMVIAGSTSRPRRAGRTEAGFHPPLDRWDALIALGLLLLALALRVTALTRFPNTYSGDEGSAGLFAVDLLTGKANNLFSMGWFSFSSLYFSVQSVAIALFGQTIEAVRMTSAIPGALTVVALYALGRAMFDRTTAVLAALYLVGSHYHIHMSRIALNNVWDGLFGTLAILGLWHGWRSGRRAGFVLCGLALGLGLYFYVTIRSLPPLFLIWAAAAFVWQRARFRERFSGLVVAAYIALVVFLPMGLFFVSHPDDFRAPLNRVSIFGQWLDDRLASGEQTTAEIIRDQAVAGALGFTHKPLQLLYDPGAPLLLAGAATLFLLGLLWALLHFDLRYLLLLLPLLAVVVSSAFSQGSPASQRYILAMPLVALFVALPVGQAAVWLQHQYPRARAAVAVAAFAILALVAAIEVNYYFNRVYDTYVLGGLNTRVATEIAYFLRDKEPADEEVYFFGFPRMGYRSLSTIPFLAPQKQDSDVLEPLTGPTKFPLRGLALFIFLPERLNELDYVREQYPNGNYAEFKGQDGSLLFAVYEAGP